MQLSTALLVVPSTYARICYSTATERQRNTSFQFEVQIYSATSGKLDRVTTVSPSGGQKVRKFCDAFHVNRESTTTLPPTYGENLFILDNRKREVPLCSVLLQLRLLCYRILELFKPYHKR